jgi:hypothetical protein
MSEPICQSPERVLAHHAPTSRGLHLSQSLVSQIDIQAGWALVHVAHKLEDVLALKVAVAGHAVGGHEGVGLVA